MRDFQRLSRREMLLLGGATVGAGAAACVCGGLSALYMLLRDDPEVVVVPYGGEPTAELPEAAGFQIVSREEWGALAPNANARNERGIYSESNPTGWYEYPEPLRDVYKTLVIHHSVISEGDDLATLAAIQELHRVDRQWADVGYHYLIGKTGTIYAGRDIGIRGAHVGGFNTGSAGICLMGDFTQELPTEPQLASTRQLLQWLTDTLAPTHITGHRNFNAETLCPGDNLIPYIAEFADELALEQGTDGYVAPIEGSSWCGCQI